MAGNSLTSVGGAADDTNVHTGFSTSVSASWVCLSASGVTWDGTDVIDCAGAIKNYKRTGKTGTIQDSFTTVGNDIGWDGSALLQADPNSDDILKYDGFTNTVYDSFAGPGSLTWGCGWDGTNALSSDLTADKFYQHNGFSAGLLDSMITPDGADTWGCGWDSANFLFIGANKAFQQAGGFVATINDSYTLSSARSIADDSFNGETPSSIKSINGLAYASVKSVNGLAKASIKSINGLA